MSCDVNRGEQKQRGASDAKLAADSCGLPSHTNNLSMNGATLPPWLSPWASGLVYGQRVYKPGASGEQAARERLRPRLTIYTLGHEHSAPILSWSENGGPSASPPMEAGPPGSAVRWERVPMGAGGPMRWERVPIDNSPWHVGVPVAVQPEIIDRPPLLERAEEEGAAGAAAAWSGVVRGWAAGAALLALLVVIARVAEHFLDWKFLLRRRRMQREWQRANVRATCRTEEGFVIPGDAEAGPGELGPCSVDLPPAPRAGDLPPPYSELSPGGAPKVEEPPPPYAEGDSCVRFINKNGIPVLVFNRARAARDPEGRRQVQRILRAAGIDLATLGPPPLAPDDRDHSPIDFNPTSVISIITNDNEVETCLIGEASAPKNADVEEGSSQETSFDNGASTAETSTANNNGDDDAEDGAVAV